MAVLKATQADIAQLCQPPCDQPAINQFENAKTRLTHGRAKQLAAAYFQEMWDSKDPERQRIAEHNVWSMWLANVEEYGSATMKREAKDFRCNWTEQPWDPITEGLFATAVPVESVQATRVGVPARVTQPSQAVLV